MMLNFIYSKKQKKNKKIYINILKYLYNILIKRTTHSNIKYNLFSFLY